MYIALVPGLPRFDLPFAFTIIHKIGRSMEIKTPVFRSRVLLSTQTESKNGGGLGTRLICIYVSLLSIVVDCGALSDPANGQVSHTAGTTFGQTATYSCNTGYNLVGDSTRTCEATENWSGSAPTCERMFVMSNIT